MGNQQSTFSRKSEKDAIKKMHRILKEEGFTIYYSDTEKKYFIMTEDPLKNQYITTRKTINLYEEICYECYLG